MESGFAKMEKLIAELSVKVAEIHGKETDGVSSEKISTDKNDVDESE